MRAHNLLLPWRPLPFKRWQGSPFQTEWKGGAKLSLSESACGTFGGLTLFTTATHQELRDCTHPKAPDFKKEWKVETMGVHIDLLTPSLSTQESLRLWCVKVHRGKRMEGALKRSGVDPPLCYSRACLHTAFIASSVHCVFDWRANVPLALRSPPGALVFRVGSGSAWFRALSPGMERGGGGGAQSEQQAHEAVHNIEHKASAASGQW